MANGFLVVGLTLIHFFRIFAVVIRNWGLSERWG